MSLAADPARHSLLELDARTRRRNASEARFRMYGVAAIAIAVLALIVLLISVLSNGASAFRQTFIAFDVALDDGVNKQTFHLNRSYYGLYIAPMIWREIDNFSSGAVCLALASHGYDENDYYREYDAFLKAIRSEV